MPRADFYLIDKPRFRNDPLLLVCELAKKAFATEQPTSIFVGSREEADLLDEKLWAFDEQAFIPHQIVGDSDDDAVCAVLIVSPGMQTPDRPLIINLRDECAQGAFERVLEVVPHDEAQRLSSRERWKAYKQAGFDVSKHDM